MRNLPYFSLSALLWLLSFGAAVLCLQAYPLWWDEGWNLILAKNWITSSLYGERLNGEELAVALSGSPTVVLPIAFSFRLFEIGSWQARLPALLFFLLSLGLLQFLCAQLYSRSTALLSVLLCLLLGAQVHLYAPLLGTQAVGEIVVVFFILLGYCCLLPAHRSPRRYFYLLLALLSWGLAFYTKNQVRPFLFVAAVLPLLLPLIRKRPGAPLIWFSMSVGPYAVSRLLHLLRNTLLLAPQNISSVSLEDLYRVTAVVLDADARSAALSVVTSYALPLCIALLFTFVHSLSNKKNETTSHQTHSQLLIVSLWCLLSSWGAWFLLLSVGWPRYLYPAFILGNAFVAYALTLSFSTARSDSSQRGFSQVCFLALLLSILPSLWQTPELLMRMTAPSPLQSTEEAARLVNENALPDALVETYETELFFLLEREYHHPPDEVHVALNRRRFLKEKTPLNYTGLEKDPDVILLGPVARAGGLYQEALRSGRYRPVAKVCHAETACPYEIFARK